MITIVDILKVVPMVVKAAALIVCVYCSVVAFRRGDRALGMLLLMGFVYFLPVEDYFLGLMALDRVVEVDEIDLSVVVYAVRNMAFGVGVLAWVLFWRGEGKTPSVKGGSSTVISKTRLACFVVGVIAAAIA